ncbi:ATPase domain-containing protein [Rubrivirga litoralis]|uniref:non-specific serine/threonine protein kinase n=1 Tax=Rubrivirga litoralis TaxID=3075598 RepID=A0ABU3BSG6_9BACT|nr:ATPase domain-containing protein [Rubrivirga sp. F394]MDT0632232.1 ATPase domain-containing protein [Rubrivirga sp. F394]
MAPQFPDRVPLGVAGLDHILRGGVPRDEVYLVQGGPGTGKTTLALEFLQAGAAVGEAALYVTLSQTRPSLERIAWSHGWNLDGVEVREVGVTEDAAQTVFHPSEVQLSETLAAIREAVEEVGPARLVIDTVADLRVLSVDRTQYRRELFGLRRFLSERSCTALFLDDSPENGGDRELQNQANGVLSLRQESPEYGEVRRWLQVVKMRSTPFPSGGHNFRIRTGGLAVFPRVEADGENGYETWEPLSSGVPELDAMLGGGLREGTTCLVAGPTGSGKSAVAFRHAHAAAERGETAAVFLFNERLETFYMRARGLGMDMEAHVEAGRLVVRQVNTGALAPSEFAQQVREAVEDDGARVVVIDSLSGYINAMLRRDLLVSQLHELVTYLSQHGVLTLLVVDRHGTLTGDDPAGPAHVSYLADSVLLLGYHEEDGVRHRTITVLKQRHGDHAKDARELHLSAAGLAIGDRIGGVGLTLDPHLFATLHAADGPSNGRPPARA